MAKRDDPPAFAHGRGGVPLELEIYVRCRGAASDGPNDFSHAGVNAVAREQLEVIEHERERATHGGYQLHVPEAVRSWTYALHGYCAKFGQPAPPLLLQLTFAALNCVEATPAKEVRCALGLPVDITKLDAFSLALSLDAEALARTGQRLSVYELARQVGVTRATIRTWRGRADFESKISAVANLLTD